MTSIAKALKEKNKLKQEIAQLQKRLMSHNSVIKGNPRPFDIAKTDNELYEKINQLIVLKSALTKANQPVQEKIYRLAELKGLIAFYKKIPASVGISTERYGSDTFEYEACFNEAILDEKIKNCMLEAEKIQDELDSFNYTNNI